MREHQEATLDQAKVTVGAVNDERGLAMCSLAVRWHGRVSDDGEAVAVPLACAR